MALDPRRVKALFNTALDLPDAADRAAFLERECRDDLELRRRLEELLAAHNRPATVLDRPLAEDPSETSAPDAGPGPTASIRPAAPAPDALIGSVIAGRYKLREEIGEGGMGSVYLAEQTHPVKRQVALKLIKPGMDSRTVPARFESERQVLALMDHPSIARVLDAGATESGRPYFVMELVKGIPLTDYCDQHRLGLPERLALFRQICSAVQHAHQKGIIHRDLKPSNILVESHDGQPVPKVIDFGLAKATSGLQLTEQSLFTAFGTVAGTPLYMAPEQATFNALDVDTRADIYALGVILYELLTGSTPIRRETFNQAALDEILRVVREVEPPTPSSRISTSEALPAIAASRQTEPARLGRFVRGDLDWIVMKALAKERHRRYESAIALAQDLERFTNHEPVSAGPPTASYRLRKFVRRNRPQVVAAALVLLALLTGIMGTTLGLLEARRQTRIAVAESREKEKARQAEAVERKSADRLRRIADEERRTAQLQRQRAEKRLGQIEKVNEILASIFTDLNPHSTEDKPLSTLLGERLDHATAALEGEAIGDPLAVARMQMTLGFSQRGLGYYQKAIDLLTRAQTTLTAQLGPDHREALECANEIALAYRSLGNSRRAMELLEEILPRRKATLGPDHPDTLATMDGLASVYRQTGKPERVLPLLSEIVPLRKAKLGIGHRDTLISIARIAVEHFRAKNFDVAVPLLEEILELRKTHLGPDHIDSLGSMNELADGYRAIGKLDRALPLYEEALRRIRSKVGPESSYTLNWMNELALVYMNARTSRKAIPLFEELYALQKAKLGPDHPRTLTSMNNLAVCYENVGNFERAVPLLEETVAQAKAKYGADKPRTLINMGNLASAYRRIGQPERALPLFEEMVATRKSTPGPDHPDTLNTMDSLASTYQSNGKNAQAVALFEETLRLRTSKLGPEHADTLVNMDRLAVAYQRAGKIDRALPLHEETYATMKTRLGPDDPRTLTSMSNLAGCYRALGKLDLAVPLLEDTLARRKSKLGPEHASTVISMQYLASAYELSGRRDLALPLWRGLGDLWKRKDGANSARYADAMALVGQNLLQQKQWVEAEMILRDILTIRDTREAEEWRTFNRKSLLGGALLGQKKYEDAEPLLRAGYEGMKLRAEKIPAAGKVRLAEALDRLIELAEATNKPEEARALKDEKRRLQEAPPPRPESEGEPESP
jgi:serine/threonine protein kinase